VSTRRIGVSGVDDASVATSAQDDRQEPRARGALGDRLAATELPAGSEPIFARTCLEILLARTQILHIVAGVAVR